MLSKNQSITAIFTSPKLYASRNVFRYSSSSQVQQKGSADFSKYETMTSNLKDITHNAKQETKENLGTVINAVSGITGSSKADVCGEGYTGNSKGSEVVSDLRSLTGLAQMVPRGAIIFGAAGLVPYFATSAASVYLARQAFLAERGLPANFDVDTALTLLYHNENLQVTYGAVILSALGTIHWGIDFASRSMQTPQAGQPLGTQRYWLGAFPAVLAWPTLLLPNELGLASQWAAFTLVWYADMMATSWGWTPRWYSTYRFGLTAVVGSCLIITLAARNYWSLDDTEYASMSKKLQAIQEHQYSQHLNSEDKSVGGGRVEGVMDEDAPVGSVSGDKAFVRLTDVAGEKRKQLKLNNVVT